MTQALQVACIESEGRSTVKSMLDQLIRWTRLPLGHHQAQKKLTDFINLYIGLHNAKALGASVGWGLGGLWLTTM